MEAAMIHEPCEQARLRHGSRRPRLGLSGMQSHLVLVASCLMLGGCFWRRGQGTPTCAYVPPPEYVCTVDVDEVAAEPQSGAGLMILPLPMPAYPAGFARVGISGEVRLRFTVHPDGSVSGIRIVKSSARQLEDAVLSVAPKWRFQLVHCPGAKSRAELSASACVVFKAALKNEPGPAPQSTTSSPAREERGSEGSVRYPSTSLFDLNACLPVSKHRCQSAQRTAMPNLHGGTADC